MAEQTAAGRAQEAENRAKKQQREQLRAVLRDPEARAVLAGDPAIREMVAQEVRAERQRQELEDRQARDAETRERAELYAPKQTSTRSDPWAGDFEHSTDFMARMQAGESPERVRAEYEDKQRREAAELAEHQAVLWTSGDFAAVRQGQAPATGEPVYDSGMEKPPGRGMGLPPRNGRQRSVPYPDQQGRPATGGSR